MSISQMINRVQTLDWKKHEGRVKELVRKNPILIGGGVLSILLLLNFIASKSSREQRIMERPHEMSFQNGRILNDRESTFYYGKERQLSLKAQVMMDNQQKIEARLAELEKKATAPQPLPNATIVNPTAAPTTIDQTQKVEDPKLYPPGQDTSSVQGQPSAAISPIRRLSLPSGPSLIAFPVKSSPEPDGLVLPAGSYVKAKIMTGVDVPEGKTYPVLMVLDYSYVAPNDHKVDLSGCFMIAKAEGDLSTERVQMQATKMSCVSKRGKMFEREVNGFIADHKDGAFAMQGEVHSKQGRVAAMAFLSGVVEGVGKAVQSIQTTQQMTPLGGSQSTITGDQEKYMLAGGASNAAGMVAQWYLKEAQSLSPTVYVDSGRDVWIVMKDKVNLPDEFFKKEKSNEGTSYFTRIVD